MKKIFHFCLIILSSITLTSCHGHKEVTISLDLLLCELPKGNRLTEQQVKMLLPFENDGIRYLPEGNVFNTSNTIVYTKEKGLSGKLATVQKTLSNHLKGLNLSSLSLASPMSVEDANKYSNAYNSVLGFSTKQPQNPSAYPFKIYTKSEEILSYITGTILVNDPEAKILIVYNPSLPPDSIIKKDTETPVASEEIKPQPKKGSKEIKPEVSSENATNLERKQQPVEPVSKKEDRSQATNIASQLNELNNLLNSIANSNDAARDRMSKLNSVRVNGATNISNVKELITDVSNGTRYTITDVQTDDKGKVLAITVSK